MHKLPPAGQPHRRPQSAAARQLYPDLVAANASYPEPADNYAKTTVQSFPPLPATNATPSAPVLPTTTDKVTPHPSKVHLRNYLPQGEPFVQLPSTVSQRTFTFKSKTPRRAVPPTYTGPRTIPETPPKQDTLQQDTTTLTQTELDTLAALYKEGARPSYRHRTLVFPQQIYANYDEMDTFLWTHSQCVLKDKRCSDLCPIVPTPISLQ